MLTEALQEAIATGKAVFKTWSVGGSGVGTIPVPRKKFIVIIDFDYHYFIDFPTEGEIPNDFSLRRSVYQLEFRSEFSQNSFIIRNPLVFAPGEEKQQIVEFEPYHKDTYLVHSGDVQVNIVNVPDAAGWITTYSKLPALSNESPLPMGYGIDPAGVEAVRKIIFAPGEQYLPLTRSRDDIAAVNPQDQFRVNVNAINKLNDVRKEPIGNYGYPIVNVQYVEFSRNPNQFVKSSN
jgi:hypothetical protein